MASEFRACARLDDSSPYPAACLRSQLFCMCMRAGAVLQAISALNLGPKFVLLLHGIRDLRSELQQIKAVVRAFCCTPLLPIQPVLPSPDPSPPATAANASSPEASKATTALSAPPTSAAAAHTPAATPCAALASPSALDTPAFGSPHDVNSEVVMVATMDASANGLLRALPELLPFVAALTHRRELEQEVREKREENELLQQLIEKTEKAARKAIYGTRTLPKHLAKKKQLELAPGTTDPADNKRAEPRRKESLRKERERLATKTPSRGVSPPRPPWYIDPLTRLL